MSNKQLGLRLRERGWGGWRPGAGRKPGPNPRVRHRSREPLASRYPCHVTLKVREDLPSLRTVRFVREFERSVAEGNRRGDFRLVHYSLQSNHAHLIVEAKDASALGRGMKAVGIRLAKAVNRVFDRRGPVLADRYHMRALKTPREVRRALAYVLLNSRRHARRKDGDALRPDPASSGRWFQGWRDWAGHEGDAPTAGAHTWLLREGWRRHGLLGLGEVPGPALAPG